MRKLLLNPDWHSSPIEIDYSEGYDDWFEKYGSCIDPENLPLSPSLVKDIWTWADTYDTFLNWDEPATPVDVSPPIEKRFWEQGYKLQKELQGELGPDYQVSYQPPLRYMKNDKH